ncbi:hypothetical protein PbB2_02759 [Candidatus Phycosocius bacilliformis]|uniref:site-specific DNA-methyltransferase (adenine-specific) n=1 Tax=Candidatus Phycosocius bacilliformis TaxID=1445552 RepID=A0A2P2EDD0_9PROT|nr:restriction endonuclease [Candidatus Phycosocius bacilliformis]GBF59067.1 hypothetical protein PbB2_02759 [Candidatus Phycosocius bacilliformis]
MNDPTLFAAGALFTQDYLSEGITSTSQYREVDARKIREAITEIMSGFPHSSRPNEATTESDFVWPILRLLGWGDYLTQQNLSPSGRTDVPDGLLFIDAEAKARANAHPEEWKRYQFGSAIIESKRWGRALDRAEGRRGDDKDTPSTQLLRYLRRIDDLTNGELRWGILTNGAKWRLYFAGARSTIDDYLEIDLARVMRLDADLLNVGITEPECDHWLAVFIAMFSRSAFSRSSSKAPNFHDIARKEASFYEERVSKSLSDLVFNQLYPALSKAVAKSAPADTSLQDVRQATLILLYRLLFVLYAEDRGLLPVKDTRYDDYALRLARLDVGRRKDAGDTFSGVAKTYWNRFADLAVMIDQGDPSVGLPPYNGGLFSATQTPLLKVVALPDDVMADAIDILSWERQGGKRRYINYRDLSVQQLGSIYERLLEFELTRDEHGALDVKPNIFARKTSGSYYTPDDLVLLILDETLKPLINDAMDSFKNALGQLRPGDSEDFRVMQLQKVDPAKAITRLRICDPAMGSGHFLVNLVDRLTNHTLDAIAEAQAQARDVAGLDYESPVAEEVRKVRATIRHNAQDSNWTVSDEQLDDPQLVKRMVLKRCVYGVDKNPMAVELAKVALWLHTFTVGAPLSFIDHHLAAGDSLFGLWVRDAIDKAAKGGELLYFEALANAQRQAVVMRTIESLTDAEIAEAHRSAEMWKDVEAQTGALDGFVSFLHALDWLDLPKADKPLITLWLDAHFGEPIAIARGRMSPDGSKTRPEEVERFTSIWRQARALIEEERFLNWQITFPGVWDNWASAAREGGFDAVVGNPPWAKVELEASKWFAGRNEAIVQAATNAEREELIDALREGDPELFAAYETAKNRFAQSADVARKGGAYPLFGRGRPNLYQLFFEQALKLIKPTGFVGFLVPSGIISDKVASEFVKSVAPDDRIRVFWDFENRRPEGGRFFADVDGRFKLAVTILGGKDRKFDHIKAGFFLPSTNADDIAKRVIPLQAALFDRFNPGTGTAIIFRDKRDAAITSEIYSRLQVMQPLGSEPAWKVTFSQMLNQSNDSKSFKTAEWLMQNGWYPVADNRWKKGDEIAFPLYEGKMVQAFDHRAADIVLNPENRRRAAQPVAIGQEEHADPNRYPVPRAFVVGSAIPAEARLDWIIAYKDTTATTNIRTMIASILPACGAVHALPVLLPATGHDRSIYISEASFIVANLNSICFDYLGRQKVQTNHFSWYIVEQLPVIPCAAYARQFGSKTAADIVREAVLELTYTSHDMAPFARDMGHLETSGEVRAPFVWNEERRLTLRAKLDALYFILYGVFDPNNPETSREDIRYIYSTFNIVERQERAAYAGKYRSRDLALSWINALMAGQPDAAVLG